MTAAPPRVRPMLPEDVPAADRAYRLAFGTAFRLPDPTRFRGDGAVLGARRATWPDTAFVAERDGAVIGSITGMDWGSVVVLGPLTVHPDHWDGGVARALLDRFMAIERVANARLGGLFTFPDSPKHIALYEKRGFAPRFLTAVLSKAPAASAVARFRSYGALAPGEREATLEACRRITDANYPGLDLAREIECVRMNGLGDTLLVDDAAGRLAGFAVCHAGGGTEAGSGIVFVKCGATMPGDAATFAALIDACEAFAAARAATSLRLGVNTARRQAYGLLRGRGFRIDLTGLSMVRPDQTGTAADDRFVVDDWR